MIISCCPSPSLPIHTHCICKQVKRDDSKSNTPRGKSKQGSSKCDGGQGNKSNKTAEAQSWTSMLFVRLLLLLLLVLPTIMHFNPVMGMANYAKVNTFGLSEVPRNNEAQVVAEHDGGQFGAVLPMCPLLGDSNSSELKLLGPNFMLQNDSVRLVSPLWLCLVVSILLSTTYVRSSDITHWVTATLHFFTLI